MKLSPSAYAAAFIIAALCAVTEALDLERATLIFGLGPALADRAPYFTIWTNWFVLATFLWMLGTGRMASTWWLGGLTLWIAITGVVFQVLLRGDPLFGIRWWVDLVHHGITPVLVLLWWLAFAPKWPMPWLNALTWLIWPAVYLVFAVTRGLMIHEWTYGFLNVDDLGWPGFWVSIGQLMAAFFAAGLVEVAVARAIAGVSGANRR